MSTNSSDCSLTPVPAPSNEIKLIVILGRHIMSKKNKHYPSAGGHRILMDKKTKVHMENLENAILFELYSSSRTTESETHSECLKQLRTVLSGLSDDSIREVPSGSWGVEYATKGNEGVAITITPL